MGVKIFFFFAFARAYLYAIRKSLKVLLLTNECNVYHTPFSRRPCRFENKNPAVQIAGVDIEYNVFTLMLNSEVMKQTNTNACNQYISDTMLTVLFYNKPRINLFCLSCS